jgi:hypothetical protein
MSLLVKLSTSELALRVRESTEAGAQLVTMSDSEKALLVRESTSPLALRVKGLLDPLTSAFAAASGATSLSGIDALIKYCRAQSLLDSVRLYTFKSAQNAGTGSTLYGVGSLTAENMTLVGSPSWASGAMAFNGSSQYWSVADFIGSETLTVFSRASFEVMNAANTETLITQYDTGANKRSWMVDRRSGSSLATVRRSSDGTALNSETFDSNYTVAGSDVCYVAQWVAGGGRSLWINKSGASLALGLGNAQTTRFNSDAVISGFALFNSGTPGTYGKGSQTAVLIIAGPTPADAQREALTDLINAL